MANKEMRVVLCEKMIDLMGKNDKVVMVESDLSRSNGTFDVRKHYPDRVVDCGIAEANMACVAAGMASYGFIPFTTTFTAFSSRRICDQITLSIAYAGNNVKIIGTDAGLTAELNGGTHMSVEDIAVLRGIPNLVILDVVDPVQLEQAIDAVAVYEGPVYIRMSRKLVEDVFDPAIYHFDLFKADTIKEGKDVSIFASSIMVAQAQKAVELLKAEGIDAELINIHTIKPLDTQTVIASAKKTGAVVTCENSSVVGGMGSAVAEALAKEAPTPVEMVGIQDRFGQVGFLPFLLEEYKMTPEDIVAAAKKAISRK
ncbi:transketolase family protein [Anaerolentibacter hominis]|uniref:transketolase family protein n=1 Tax=Anaerolentibacter hominis TaxID=3079009 RepID=UPI0031B88070